MSDDAGFYDCVVSFAELAAGGLIDHNAVETPLAFHALAAQMDQRGVLVRVDGDALEFVGGSLPGWCEPIVRYWWDLIICAHAGLPDFRLVACETCGELSMLDRRKHNSRRCIMPGCKGHYRHIVPIRFVDQRARRASLLVRCTPSLAGSSTPASNDLALELSAADQMRLVDHMADLGEQLGVRATMPDPDEWPEPMPSRRW